MTFPLQHHVLTWLSSACEKPRVPPRNRRFSTHGRATRAITPSLARAACVRSSDTSWPVSAATPRSTRQKEVCRRRACCTQVSSVRKKTPSLLAELRPDFSGPRLLQLLSLGARAGVLHPLGGDGSASAPTLSDRFQLGGPTNLRMFRANTLGPRDGSALFLFSFFLSFFLF